MKSKKLSERLRSLRKDSGLTLQEIAEKLNSRYDMHTTKGMLSKYENGVHEPNSGTLHCLAEILGVSADYLTGKTDEKTPDVRAGKLGVTTARTVKVSTVIFSDGSSIDDGKGICLPTSAFVGGKDFFAIRIKGGRLAPRFLNGDTVIFEKKKRCSRDGVAAVIVGNGNAILCTVQNKRSGKLIIPLDPAVQQTFYSTAEIRELPVRILGEAIELRRSHF